MDAYDLRTLFDHREILSGLDPAGAPSISLLGPAPPARRVGILPGSFNPPTAAHLLLAERALGDEFDAVVFLLPCAPAGKSPSGLVLEDRLLALRTIAAPPSSVVAVCSASLYCDQAEAAAGAFEGAEVSFLVGSDKVVQIFEDRWYADRDESLNRLFANATVVVAPRADGGESVRRTMAEPRNALFASRIQTLPLHPAVSDLSSTRVRGLLQSGAESIGLVPAAVAEFLAEIAAFAPVSGVDRYALRARLIDVLWAEREWAVTSADLRALVRAAAGNEEFRRALLSGEPPGVDALRLEQDAAAGG